MSRRIGVLLLAALLPLQLAAQQLVTFTESDSGNGKRPIGYPVPVPVASLEAVDGFRDYASLEARLQALALASDDLAAHQVGTTQGHGRPLWAYRVGDPDGTDHEGAPEAAFFINAGIHAREWGTQEISTWLVERMMAGADDGGLVRWLLDTTTLVIIPVLNVDGFLQTQRYPLQALVGADPRFPDSWPRDGRMRRKNMRGVDELLQTTGDHLGGIDLNRNHPPFWATSTPNYSSNDPKDLIYHGSGPHSEAESQALLQALLLAPPERLRMGVDIHSFSQVFYSSNTGQSRLNAVQGALLARVSAHHRAVAVIPGAGTGPSYPNVHDPAGVGGGLLAEYLAYEFRIPAWTLEIEPDGQRGGRQYGGTSDGHAGFILPASQVRRVREGWAESHLLAFYYMAGAPYLEQVRLVDEASGITVLDTRWQRQGAARERSSSGTGALQPGRRYRAELVFSKPMRIAGADGAAAPFPNQFVEPNPRVVLQGPGQQQELDTAAGGWMQQGRRWAFDRFEFSFDAPEAPGAWALQVDAMDAVGHRLDANPATPVDWVLGAWSGLEDSLGTQGDEGGVDATTQLSVVASELVLEAAPSVVGEGEPVEVVLARTGGDGPLQARLRVLGDDAAGTPGCPFLEPSPVGWSAGESGTRTLLSCVEDDLVAQGTRTLELRIDVAEGEGDYQLFASLAVEVLDNDGDGAAVLRASPGRLRGVLSLLPDGGDQAVELVLGGGDYALEVGPFHTCAQNRLRGPLVVHGNHARIRHAPGAGDCMLLAVEGEAPVELRQLTLLGRRSDGAHASGSLVHSGAPLVLRSVVLDDGGPGAAPVGAEPGALLNASAGLVLEQSALTGLARSGASAARLDGAVVLRSAALTASSGPETLIHLLDGATAQVTGSTLLPTSPTGHAISVDASASASLSSSLLQHAATGTLCDGAGEVASLGGNVASDASCGQAAGDRIPRRPALPQLDALTGAPFPAGDAVDVGGDCPTVDLRGAPRPQSMDGDATPLCDAGAIELGINPYRGLWIPERSGHGVDIHTAGNLLFLTWYTYHPDGTPAAYQASAPLLGPHWQSSLDSARRLPDGSIERFSAGEIELDFASDTQATLRWRINEGGQEGEEGLSAYFFAAGEPRIESTGTWYDPSDSGWGLTVTRRGAITGLVLYYYDAAGELRWALAQGGDGDVLELPLFGYTGFCPDCDAAANPAQAAPAGTLRVQFLTPRRVRAWVDAGPPGQPRFQRSGARLVPLSDAVDNRRAAAAAQSAASSDPAL